MDLSQRRIKRRGNNEIAVYDVMDLTANSCLALLRALRIKTKDMI